MKKERAIGFTKKLEKGGFAGDISTVVGVQIPTGPLY